MKKYEAPVVELDLFAVENIMAAYEGGDDDMGELGPNDTEFA